MRVEERAKQEGMVRWFSPGQLVNTAAQVLVSMIFGTRADYRIIEALRNPQPEPFDYSGKKDIWIDYVSDIGDGWNPTYSIASLLSRASLKLSNHDQALPRADILVMGGDEVYPVAGRAAYENRFKHPYRAASNPVEGTNFADLFAIPGNHDWYDGLISFMRVFTEDRAVGAWRTRQERSYFALKLPQHWWLLGVDIQLESDIDAPQLHYFKDVAQQMQAGDRVLVCIAQPDWYYGTAYDPLLENNLDYLENNIIRPTGAEIRLRLSGDLHFYMRHEATDGSGTQMIISGGGGAFLKSTRGPNVEKISYRSPRNEINFMRKCEYPSQSTSWFLALRNLYFPFLNPFFGVLTAMGYLPIAWIPLKSQADSFLPGLLSAFGELLQRPAGFLWTTLLIGVFILFTDTHKTIYRWIAGGTHALCHVLAALSLSLFVFPLFELFSSNNLNYWLRLGLALTGGYALGSFIMGLYLLVSLVFFRRHSEEAFSALRIQDYKNFLRLHICEDGVLEVFPVGLERVPRLWRFNAKAKANEPLWLPEDLELVPKLIEDPIRV